MRSEGGEGRGRGGARAGRGEGGVRLAVAAGWPEGLRRHSTVGAPRDARHLPGVPLDNEMIWEPWFSFYDFVFLIRAVLFRVL